MFRRRIWLLHAAVMLPICAADEWIALRTAHFELLTNAGDRHAAGLLPYLGHDEVYRSIERDKFWRSDRNLKAGSVLVPPFLDPRFLQRFLTGESTLTVAWVGPRPVGASNTGDPVDLPDPDTRRDGSGAPVLMGPQIIGHLIERS